MTTIPKKLHSHIVTLSFFFKFPIISLVAINTKFCSVLIFECINTTKLLYYNESESIWLNFENCKYEQEFCECMWMF